MFELSVQELTEFGKISQGSSFDAQAVGLAQLRRANKIAERNIATLRSAEQPIDAGPDATVLELNNARDAIGKLCESLRDKQRGRADPADLSLLIAEAASLHNNLNTLSWLVGENQADQDETSPERFNDADDLFNAMGV